MKKPTKAQIFIDDMIRCRGMDFVRLGMRVEMGGQMGTVKGMNSSANLNVVFDNPERYGKGKVNCHPTWDIAYFDKEGNVIADYREKSQAAE